MTTTTPPATTGPDRHLDTAYPAWCTMRGHRLGLGWSLDLDKRAMRDHQGLELGPLFIRAEERHGEPVGPPVAVFLAEDEWEEMSAEALRVLAQQCLAVAAELDRISGSATCP